MRNKSVGARNRARTLRKNQSVAEQWVWNAIRKEKLGFRFRRQFAVGPYILDFYCPEVKLCIEMDSDLHDLERDKIRDRFLADQGILTIRIPNVDYLELEGKKSSKDWLRHIQQVCEERSGRSGE
ncbi:MAG: DUF559 domain-containing protein [Armatimonadetes bacterium]|nr:DUF559 domain-containing protein [Armatimonadota bacterium]